MAVTAKRIYWNRKMRRQFVTATIILVWWYSGTELIKAETLNEALAMAYQTNPQLLAQRAQDQAINESMPQALANWHPSVMLDLKEGRGRYENNTMSLPEQIRVTRSGSMTITQPLYRGGRTMAATRQAGARIMAEWAQLLSVEQTILREAARAYLDVVRDKAILDLSRSNEQVLQHQLEATRDRFSVGEITKTDISQAEARLARATAARLASDGKLQSSRATYRRIVGVMPGTLVLPSTSPNLPSSLQEVVEAAIAINPLVGAAQYTAQAARHGIDLIRGELFPTVNLIGILSRNWNQDSRDLRSETAEVMLRISVPIYQQGIVYARLREAKYTAGQRRLEHDQVRRTVIEAATQAWEELQSAYAQIKSFQTQITSAEIALDGVKREAQVGSRTVLDVLNAEQELVDARVALVRAQRDNLQAEYQLLSAIGRMTAKDLSLPVEIYSPRRHIFVTTMGK